MPAESHRRCSTQPVDPRRQRGFAGAALGALLAVLLCCASWVQAQPRPRGGGDVFSATEPGRGGDTFGASATDTGRCRDPQIAVIERRERARAYLDTTGKVKMAADYLARKHGDPFVNRGSVCMHHPGVIFMIPEQFDAEFRQLMDVFNASPQPDEKRDDTGPRPSPLRPGTPLLSRSGCPFPPELDPRNMDPRHPWEARLQTAESVLSQRQRLCQQGQGYLVKETCARVCAAEPQAQTGRPPQVRRGPDPVQPASCTPPQARRHPGGLEPAEEFAHDFVKKILSYINNITINTTITL